MFVVSIKSSGRSRVTSEICPSASGECDLTTTAENIFSSTGDAAHMIGAALSTRSSVKVPKKWSKRDLPKDGRFDWNQA